jgi:hypothetical protein
VDASWTSSPSCSTPASSRSGTGRGG